MKKKKHRQKRPVAQPQKQRRQETPLVTDAKQPTEGGSPAAALLLTIADVCGLLQISRATFYRLEKAEKLPGRLLIGGQVRFHRETLENWLRAQVGGQV